MDKQLAIWTISIEQEVKDYINSKPDGEYKVTRIGDKIELFYKYTNGHKDLKHQKTWKGWLEYKTPD